MKVIAFCLFCSAVLLSPVLQPGARSQQIPPEKPRMKLYVGEIRGDEDLVKSIRVHLVDELTDRDVVLVASEEESDATLKGVGVHRIGTRLMLRTKSTTSIVIRGELRLITRDGRTLWSTDVSSKRWAFSETASFAQIGAGRVAQFLGKLTPHNVADLQGPPK